jgi:hypothetical protein
MYLFAFPTKTYTGLAHPNYRNEKGKDQFRTRENHRAVSGLKAGLDAMNIWDIFTAFAGRLQWLTAGMKIRGNDRWYKASSDDGDELQNLGLPIANEFHGSKPVPRATNLAHSVDRSQSDI